MVSLSSRWFGFHWRKTLFIVQNHRLCFIQDKEKAVWYFSVYFPFYSFYSFKSPTNSSRFAIVSANSRVSLPAFAMKQRNYVVYVLLYYHFLNQSMPSWKTANSHPLFFIVTGKRNPIFVSAGPLMGRCKMTVCKRENKKRHRPLQCGIL